MTMLRRLKLAGLAALLSTSQAFAQGQPTSGTVTEPKTSTGKAPGLISPPAPAAPTAPKRAPGPTTAKAGSSIGPARPTPPISSTVSTSPPARRIPMKRPDGTVDTGTPPAKSDGQPQPK